MKLFTIPNLFTLGNLLCGTLAIIYALAGDLVLCAYLVGVAAVLDFFDGFVARLLNSSSPIGQQLDSLADCVTFGVVPGIVLMVMVQSGMWYSKEGFPLLEQWPLLSYVPLVVVLFSALRLAKFNVDTRQSESFIGVPTPANAMLVCALPLMAGWDETFSASAYATVAPQWVVNPFFLIGLSLVMSLLLICELPLFALKFKSFGWAGNEIRWSFLAGAVALIAVFGYAGIALTIVAYIVVSFVVWLLRSNKETPAEKP